MFSTKDSCELAESPEVCLSLRPLVWALALGGCLGGAVTTMFLQHVHSYSST